jgi:hypothetical protein
MNSDQELLCDIQRSVEFASLNGDINILLQEPYFYKAF